MVNLITTDSYFNLFKLLVAQLKLKGNSIEKKNIVFCEEKVSLMTERLICYELGGSFNTEVYSFGNFLRAKNPMCNILSKEGSAMAVKKILSLSSLKCFKTSKLNLAPTLYELIMQLKSAGISPSDILIGAQNSDGVLKNKLEDVYAVFSEYEKFVSENGFDDQSSVLSYLPEVISKSTQIKDAHIFLVGFAGFTAQIRAGIERLIDCAKSVTAILCEGENPLVYVNETANHIRKLCKEKGVKLTETKVNSDYTHEGKLIVDGAFKPIKKGVEKTESQKIYCLSANNAYSEAERVAEIIKKSILSGECRYRDITVALPSVAEYKTYIKSAFDTLEIPYFLDQRKKPDNHPLITLIIQYVDLFKKNFERKALSAFFKNPLVIDDKAFADEFENYIVKYNINYGRIKSPFTLADKKEDLESLENFRINLCEVLNDFNVRKMLSTLGVKEKIENFNKTLCDLKEMEEAAINDQIYESVIRILNEMDLMLGGVKLSLTEFKNVFLSGINALELSIIPQYNDAVFIGEYKETALAKAKYLFALGLTAEVPAVRADVALLSDGDIDALEKIKVMVEPKIKIINHRVRENVVLALSAFSERLYLSCPVCGIDGKKKEKCELLSQIESRFTIKQFPEHDGYITKRQGIKTFAKECGEFSEGQNIDFINASSFYQATDGDKAKDLTLRTNKEVKVHLEKNAELLVANELSPTAIEDYYKCPYRAFLAHGLRLKQRDDGDVGVLSIGNLMHEVLRVYAMKLNLVEDEQTSNTIFYDIKNKLLDRDEYKKFLSDSRTAATVERVLNECRKYCYDTFVSFNETNFKVKNTEASFGEGKEYPPIKLLDGRVKLKGKIDRVDENDEYFRVIDYKTGSVDASDKLLFSGVKLQLYLYAAAVQAKFMCGEKKPAGLYYLPISDKYKKEDEKEKSFAVGKTLLDGDEPLAKEKDGKIKNALNEDDLCAYVDYAVKLSSLAAQRLIEGTVVASPYGNTCDFCEFKSMCFGDEKMIREINKVTQHTIIDAIKGGDSNA